MKKFFKNITKKSPSKGPPPGGSPKPVRGASAAGPSDACIGYDVRDKDLGKLHKAAWTGDVNKVKQLAKKDHSPLDKENRTPLHLACARGHSEVVQELLEWKAKINIGDNYAKTPLMKAIECQHVSCVGLLLEHHANVEAMDTLGNTCLHIAIQDGHYQIATMLINAGASPNAKNKNGESILHTAVKDKSEELSRLLLQSNADANIIDSEYRIPLMYACQDGSINIVKLLLEYHADTTYKEDKGWTADDYAVIKGHHACSTLIADHDRKYNRGSAGSTPRTGSFPPSVSVTPRDKVVGGSLGLPAQDAAGDDSGEETSKASGLGAAGGDSWGDDTDISLAADDKAKSGKPKINLSKLVRNMSESEKEESLHSNHEGGDVKQTVEQQNSLMSQTSMDDSWAAADSPITPRRVSFKKDEDLSDIKDISMQEEQEDERQTSASKTINSVYSPSGVAASTPKVALTAEKQRDGQDKKNAFLEDLGISDVEDISEMSEVSGADPNKLKNSGAESDQQITPRPGILKKWKQDSEWDSDVEDAAMPGTGNITTQDKESTFGAVTPRLPSDQQQESDWDSTIEAVTPRQNAGLSFKQVGLDEDIDEGKDDSLKDDYKPAPLPPDYPPPLAPPAQVDDEAVQPEIEGDEVSGWDSDDGDLPSETIPPPFNFGENIEDRFDNSLPSSPKEPITPVNPTNSSPQSSPHSITCLKKNSNAASPLTSPRKSPRRQRDPSDSDEDIGESETISEWEIERKQQKLLPPPMSIEVENEFNVGIMDGMSKEEIDVQIQWEERETALQATIKKESEEAIEKERRELEEEMSEEEYLHKKHEISTLNTVEKPNYLPVFQEPTISLDDLDESQEELNGIDKETNNNVKQEMIATDIAKGQQASLHSQPPQPVLSVKDPQFSTHRELQQRLQIPGVHTALPVTTQFVSSSPFDEDDDSYASDNPDLPLDRPDATAVHYPGLLSPGHFYNLESTPDDDVLSYTSTEFDGDSFAQPVIGKDLLMNLSANDPTTVLKIQEHVRQTQKSFEQERNQRLILDNKYRLLAKEKNDLHKKIDVLSGKKSELEQNKLNLDAKIRSLEYGLTEEEEKRKNAEILLGKTKDQLVRKEEHFNSEIEAKQKAELSLRNIQLELRAANNRIKELEEDVEEVERQFQHERNARQLQEQINEEQQKHQVQHQQQQQVIRSAHQPVQRNHSGEIEETSAESEKLRAELYALQMELDRQRARLKDENSLLSSENEELHLRLEELKNSIKLNEEAMVHLTMQHNLAISNIKTECNFMCSNLEKERDAKDKAEAELNSISTRLTSTINEMENASQARNDLERALQLEKETWSEKIEKKDEELNGLKHNNTQLSQRVKSMEDKLHQMESELNVSNTSLMERTNQLQQYRVDFEKNKSFNGDSDYNYRLEKEQNSKLQLKIENLQEKLSQAQHESLNYKQQLELLKQNSSQESSASSTERIHTLMNNLRMENDKAKSALEDKNETLTRLREELRNSDNRRSTIEQDLRKITQDHTDLIKQLSSVEANLSIAVKTREHIEHEKGQLQLEIQRLQQKYESAHEKTIESQARLSELIERTERAEQNSLLSSQKLAHTSANIQANDKSQNEQRDELQKLQVSYARLESELKHEKQRADMLQEDLLDSQKVRASLEALCSNLKSTSSHLEEKLGSVNDDNNDSPLDEETANRTAFELESQESKGLWEQEIVSRSKLGLRLAQLQRQNQDSTSQLEEERRKLKKIAEGKRSSNSKYEEEKARNSELEKEVTQLKAHLKASRKRLKDTDFNDSRISSLQTEFDKERIQMEATLSTAKRQSQMENGGSSGSSGSGGEKDLIEQIRKELEAKYRLELNRKLDEVNLYLEEQSRARDKLDRSRGDNESHLMSERKRLDEENTNLRLKYEQALASKESREIESRRYRDLYDSEMRWRMRLSEQLQENSDKSLNLKSKLAAEKHRSKLQTSFGNLNYSSISMYEGNRDELLSNKLRAELDRSIAKHLEAAPHDDIIPIVRSTDESVLKSSFAKSSADYQRLLQRKFCV